MPNKKLNILTHVRENWEYLKEVQGTIDKADSVLNRFNTYMEDNYIPIPSSTRVIIQHAKPGSLYWEWCNWTDTKEIYVGIRFTLISRRLFLLKKMRGQ